MVWFYIGLTKIWLASNLGDNALYNYNAQSRKKLFFLQHGVWYSVDSLKLFGKRVEKSIFNWRIEEFEGVKSELQDWVVIYIYSS